MVKVMKNISKAILIFSAVVLTVSAYAVSPSPEELATASRWVAAKLQGKPQIEPPQGYLMIYNKSGLVERNGVTGVRGHFPLRIGDKEYDRGFYMPSVGKVTVHLPGPGQTFEAEVGVDSNDKGYMSHRGQGNVVRAI